MSKIGWRSIVLRGENPLDSRTIDAALAPDYVEGDVAIIKAARTGNWPVTALEMKQSVEAVLVDHDTFDLRLAVFPLAPVTACVYLGYLLTNRPTVRLFQYHRDEQTWVWPEATGSFHGLSIGRIQNAAKPTDIAFLFEFSARMDRPRILTMLPDNTLIISVNISEPGTKWLRDPRQLQVLGLAARDIFEECLNCYPAAETWHIFYAGPAPGGVIVGQQLNPTMTPQVQLYEYSHPQHVPSLLVKPPHKEGCYA